MHVHTLVIVPVPARPTWRWVLPALAFIATAGALPGTVPAAELDDAALEQPARGVYVRYGEQAEVTLANGGNVSNAGFVVGERCVAVIDTGGSYAAGRELRRAIRAVTPLPVCYVINTHMHPDHVFGDAAFADDHPQFVGHHRLADALRRRGANYLVSLQRTLGERADGTRIVLPTRTVETTDELDLGGRVLALRAWRTAHTDNDLTVFDRASGTLWLGDLAFVGHLPVVDGSLRGFIAVTDELVAMRADHAIPGHGRIAAWPDALAPQARYLRGLAAAVRAAIKAKRTLAETVATVTHGDDDWLLVDAFHRRNVTAAYAELEWED
jgi:quinoprotein relay system zinc metallohydrolase 2